MFITVHKLDAPFENFPGYRFEEKRIQPHPIIADMHIVVDSVPNPWKGKIKEARGVRIETANNLSFATREFTVAPGEAIQLTLVNPDVVPHNWALVQPGKDRAIGEMANQLVADPAGAARQYVPASDDVLAYTDVVPPKGEFTIYFHAPTRPGRYPYMCTFPGHWIVMNGTMIVAP